MPVNPPNRENDVDLFLDIVRLSPSSRREPGGESYLFLGPRSEAYFDLFGDEKEPVLGNPILGEASSFALAGAGLRSVREECSFEGLDIPVPELRVVVLFPKGLFSWTSSGIFGTLSSLPSPAFIAGLSTTRLEGTES